MAGSTQRERRSRRILKRALIALGSTLFALLAAEAVLRVTGMRPSRWPEQLAVKHTRPADPPLRWELVPGAESRWLYLADAFGPERLVTARINEHGLRGPSVAREKPAGTLRVICPGDSFTFGHAVQDDETWPAQLERELEAGLSPRAVEVLNCGVEGYDTSQEIAFLEMKLFAFEPDVVVLGYFVNDAAYEGSPEIEPPGPISRLILRLVGNKPIAPARWLRSVSWLAELSAQAIAFRVVWLRRSQMERLLYEDDSPGWTEVRAALRRGRDLCALRGVPFLVALYPALQRDGDHLTSREIHAIVADFCRAEGIACLDLQQAFQGLPVEDMWVHRMDMHPDAKAHGIAARAVAQRLLGGDMLRPP